MNTETKNKIKKLAIDSFMEGYWGSAEVGVAYDYVVSASEAEKFMDAFRPGVKAAYDKMMNGKRAQTFITVDYMIPGTNEALTFFTFPDTAWTEDYASFDELMDNLEILFRTEEFRSQHRTFRYNPVTKNDNGTVTIRVIFPLAQDAIPSSERKKNWARATMRNNWVKRLFGFTQSREENGFSFNGIITVDTAFDDHFQVLGFTKKV